MGVGKCVFGWILVASFGFFGADMAQAFPLARMDFSMAATSDWSNPADPAARYGVASFSATIYTPSVERPFFNPAERLAYERRIGALDGISDHIQAVIDCLGFIATDVLERYAATEGSTGEKVLAIKGVIEDHGALGHTHGQYSGLEASEASEGDNDDVVQSAETVQQAASVISGLEQYVAVQQSVLNALRDAIGDIHAMDEKAVNEEALGKAMDRLRELVGYWQMPTPALPMIDADATIPVSLR